MAEINKPRISHVAGFVKGPTLNKDKSMTFRVAQRRFTIKVGSEFAEMLLDAHRALVRFEDVGKNPKILLVLPNPTERLIRQYNEE